MRRGGGRHPATCALVAALLLVARAASANVVLDVTTPPGPLYACKPIPVGFHVARAANEGQHLRVSMNLPAVMPPQPALLLTHLNATSNGLPGTGFPCPPGGVVPPRSLMCAPSSLDVTDSDDMSREVSFGGTLYGTAAGSYTLPVQIACDAGCAQQPAPVPLKLEAYPLRAELSSTPP